MPSPVYVCDAQERPLLPTSPAYARVLLHAGKARLVAHPALPVIQLTQSVSHPRTPPVVLAAFLHEHLIELVLLIERADQPVVLHRLALDVELSIALCSEPVDIPVMLNGVQRGLSSLLPISHLVVWRPGSRSSVQLLAGAASDIPLVLRTLPSLHSPISRRVLVAVWVSRGCATTDRSKEGNSSSVLPQPLPDVGAVTRLSHGHAGAGLITALEQDSCTVQAPVAVNDTGVVWETRVTPLHALEYTWRLTEVAILSTARVQRD